MNPRAELLLAAALVALPLAARAELVRAAEGDRAWSVAEGRPTDAPADPEVRAEALAGLNLGQARLDAGSWWRALGALDDAVDAAEDTEIAALARLLRARAHAERGQLEPALEDLRWVTGRRIDFPFHAEAVDLMLALARRLAEGERRRLGGWFPWFADRSLAVRAFQDVVDAAPRGPRAGDALVERARLALALDRPEDALDSLERLVGEHASSPRIPEALAMLADIRRADSPGPSWDQASAREALLALESLLSQHPGSPQAADAPARIEALRDQVAASRLALAEFYWTRRNNPVGARLMAGAAVTLAPDSPSAKAAEALIARIDAGEEPPATAADLLLGKYPRRVGAAAAPAATAAPEPAFRQPPPVAAGER
jgi:outer membrane protein assembly factor BamD